MPMSKPFMQVRSDTTRLVIFKARGYVGMADCCDDLDPLVRILQLRVKVARLIAVSLQTISHLQS